MQRQAILVGIDDYPFRQLSSCINDACAMRDALVRHDVFAHNETLLLTGPLQPDADGPATRKEILSRLKLLYSTAAPLDRFLFYFAGHGISYRTGAGGEALNAVLLCYGVRDIDDDGAEMINLDELLERFAMRGPAEQFWVVDACRDIPTTKKGPPVVGGITWGREPEDSPRKRAALYAVAPLGRATAVAGASGLLTSRLVEALAGQGRAAYWDEAEQSYMVSLRSACDYARARLAPALTAEWQHAFLLPRIERESQPPPRPLRKLPQAQWPTPREVLLAVDPNPAIDVIEAKLKRQLRVEAQWPPPGPSRPLEPDIYSFEAAVATHAVGWEKVVPVRGMIDTRETSVIQLTAYPAFSAAGEPSAPPPPPPDSMPPEAPSPRPTPFMRVEPPRDPPSLASHVRDTYLRVDTVDPGARVAIAAPARGGTPRIITANEWHQVGPGFWRIEVRLGQELLGVAEEDLEPGEQAHFAVVARVAPAVRDVDWLPGTPVRPSATPVPPGEPLKPHVAVEPSETMGWLQGALLPTLLPLLAFRPFDTARRVLSNLQTPELDYLKPEEVGRRPVGVAVASDVDAGTTADLSRISIETRTGFPNSGGFRRVWLHCGGCIAVLANPGMLSEGTIEEPLNPELSENLLLLRVPGWDPLEVALPLLEGRVACTGIILRSEGAHEVSVASLRPADVEEYLIAPVARSVAVAAQLLAAGQSAEVNLLPALRDVSYGKWLDPVLGALAWHGYTRLSHDLGRQPRAIIARNMLTFFPGLLDSLIIACAEGAIALSQEESARKPDVLLDVFIELTHTLRRALLAPHHDRSVSKLAEELEHAGYAEFARVTRENVPMDTTRFPQNTAQQIAEAVLRRQPVLAASVDLLADLALKEQLVTHWALDRRRRLDPRAVWNAVRVYEEERR